MEKCIVKYRVGARYGKGYWQTEEFDNEQKAEKFCREKCRDGKDAKIIKRPVQDSSSAPDTSKTVDKYVEKLFSHGSNLHLF